MPEKLEIGAINLRGAGNGATRVEIAYFDDINVEMFAVTLPLEQAKAICLAPYPRMIEVTLNESRTVTHVHVDGETYTAEPVKGPALD